MKQQRKSHQRYFYEYRLIITSLAVPFQATIVDQLLRKNAS